jgi:transcriptional regulator with XRE-family HTH domain
MPKPPSDADFVPRRLRALREQLDLTQEEFAEASGINYKVYQSMEAARRWNLRWSTILHLTGLHGLSVSQFFAAAIPRSRFEPLGRLIPPRRRRSKPAR